MQPSNISEKTPLIQGLEASSTREGIYLSPKNEDSLEGVHEVMEKTKGTGLLGTLGFDYEEISTITPFTNPLVRAVLWCILVVIAFLAVTADFIIDSFSSIVSNYRAQTDDSVAGATEHNNTRSADQDLEEEPHPSLYAFIVGVDQYLDPKRSLSGAVADAKAMEAYLRTYFPSSQIRSLHNQEATRSAIIQGFRDLISNSKIKRQDPIFIFYAGHGGEVRPPTSWDTQGRKIKALVPYDYKDDGAFISEAGMGALLEELSSEKGDNIVVMLDCCYSLSMARSQTIPNSRRVRATHLAEPVPEDIDQDIFKGKVPSSVPGFGNSGTTSHMLLAACEPNELAIEQDDGGVFTRVFLDTIIAFGFDNVTYLDVIQYLPPLAGQSPWCEGANKDRIFFDSKPGEKFESMHKEEDTVDADVAPTVPEETESVQARGSVRLEPPARSISVRSLGATPPTLGAVNAAPAALPPAGLSVESKARKQDILRVCFVNKPGISEIRQALKKDWSLDGTWRRRYAFVPREKATLEVDIVDDYVVFNILNSPIDRLGLSRMPYRVKLGDSSLLRNIVMAVAHFERCWRLIPEQRALRSNVEVEFTKVESRGRKRWGPATQNEGIGNLSVNHQVEVAAGKTTYGIKITNKSSIPLYPHLFLFDCSDLSITTFYRPPLRTFDASPPLQPNGSFTIGFGGEGGQPWSHYVRDDEVFEEGKVLQDKQDVDVGIFKLFLTTRPTELAFVAQQSPFFPSEYLRLTRDWKEIKGLWDAELINIVVTRNKNA